MQNDHSCWYMVKLFKNSHLHKNVDIRSFDRDLPTLLIPQTIFQHLSSTLTQTFQPTQEIPRF